MVSVLRLCGIRRYSYTWLKCSTSWWYTSWVVYVVEFYYVAIVYVEERIRGQCNTPCCYVRRGIVVVYVVGRIRG